jgi:hypothetical protein
MVVLPFRLEGRQGRAAAQREEGTAVNESPQPPPSTVESGDLTGRDHTHTFVSDRGGSVVSIPFLTAEQLSAYEEQQNGEGQHG